MLRERKEGRKEGSKKKKKRKKTMVKLPPVNSSSV